MNRVFLQERYSIYPHLSANRSNCDLKACFCGVRFKNDEFIRSYRSPSDGTSIWKLNIAYQYKPTRNITEMFLFDLQTVGFWVLRKARCIAAIEPHSPKTKLLLSPSNIANKSNVILIGQPSESKALSLYADPGSTKTGRPIRI